MSLIKSTTINFIVFVTVFLCAWFLVPAVDTNASHDSGYSYGSDYSSGGSYGSGCCDYTYTDSSYSYGSDYSSGGFDYNYTDSSYSYGSDYSSGGTPTTYSYSAPSYSYGSDYSSGGSYGAGCCDYTYTPTTYTYGSDYSSGGTPTTYTYTPTTYSYGSDYSSGGLAGTGCCDYDYTPTTNNPPTYTSDPIEFPVYTVDPIEFPQRDEFIFDDIAYAPPSYGGGYPYVPPRYNPPSYSSPIYTPPRYDSPIYTAPPPYYTPPYERVDRPRCTIDASDTRVKDGDRVTIRWTTDDADDVDINQGIGDVAFQGSEVVRVTRDTTYTLVARNSYDSVTCQVTVLVDDDEPRRDNDNNPRCDSFTADDYRVERGDKVTLKWRTTDARDVRISNGVGDVADDGEKRVTINSDTTFILTARDGSDSDTCRVTVDVEKKSTPVKKETLRCELHISDKKVQLGKSTTISWNNTNADRTVLKDNHGVEIFDSRNGKADASRGSVIARPVKDTVYTLTAYNGNDRRTCTISVDVVSGVVPPVTGISLSQVPYTGFEAGPVLTMIFYVAIVLWGTVIAYVLVMRRKKAGVAMHGGVASANLAPYVASVASETRTETASHEPISFLPHNLPALDEVGEDDTPDSLHLLEEHATAKYALFSSDALRFIQSQTGTTEEQLVTLDRVIELAKARYMKEGDWIVINKERVVTLLS